MNKFTGKYPPEWTKELRQQIREEADNKCERCGHPHDPQNGYALTVHHLDNNKSNCARWNLAALCQRCHLHIQGKVFLPQFYMFEHTAWIVPHVRGYYESLGLDGMFGRNGDVLVLTASSEVLGVPCRHWPGDVKECPCYDSCMYCYYERCRYA